MYLSSSVCGCFEEHFSQAGLVFDGPCPLHYGHFLSVVTFVSNLLMTGVELQPGCHVNHKLVTFFLWLLGQ